jgi:nucleotide-binding universal stress UspA family protein
MTMAKKMRVLVPLDGTRESEATLPVAVRLAESYGGEVVLARLIQVIDAFGPYERKDVVQLVEEARDYLHDLASRWELPPERTQCLANYTDNAGEEIVHMARTSGASLIVMIGHGRKGLWGWLRGSICDGVVRAKVCPVVVVPAEGGDWYEPLAALPPAKAVAKAPQKVDGRQDTEKSLALPKGDAGEAR